MPGDSGTEEPTVPKNSDAAGDKKDPKPTHDEVLKDAARYQIDDKSSWEVQKLFVGEDFDRRVDTEVDAENETNRALEEMDSARWEARRAKEYAAREQQKMEARHRPWWWAIGLGLLGAVATVAALVILFQEDPPDTQTLEPPTAATQEAEDSASQPVAGAQEPLSEAEVVDANEIVAEFIECPAGTLWDDFGRYRSATPGVESPETPPETPVDKAFAVDCTGQTNRSYVFMMIVRGDAETVFTQDGTTIDLRFVVNNSYPDNLFEDDSGFTVFVGYNKQFEQYVGWVTDADHAPVSDATVEIVWLEPTTLEATVTFPGDKVDIRNVRTELLGLIQDEQERTTGRYLDIAMWTAEP